MDPLLAELADHGDDDERFLVYADTLQSRGDPRGELIALQCQRALTDEQRQRERELIAAAEAELRDELPDGALTLQWRRGFVHTVAIKANSIALVRALHRLEHPSFALTRVYAASQPPAQVDPDPGLRLLLAAPFTATLEHVAIGSRYMLPPEADALAAVIAQLPRLHTLELATATLPSPAPLQALPALTLWLGRTVDGLPAWLDRPWPALRRFGFGTLARYRPFTDELYAQFAPLFDGACMEHVSELGLVANFEQLALPDLSRRPLWRRLRRFGVDWSRLTAEDERVLAAARAVFTDLEIVWPLPAGQELATAQRFQLGRLLRQHLRRPAAALPLYEQVCAVEPTSDRLLGLGNAYADLDRHEERLAVLDRALAAAPDFATGWFSRGRALVELGRFADAIASFRAAVAADPRHATALDEIGQLSRRLGNPEAALEAFAAALVIDPRHAAGRHTIDALLETGRAKDALDVVRELRVGEPTDRQLARKEGRAYLALGRPAEALAIAEELCAAAEVGHFDRYLQFAALRDLGRTADALAASERILFSDPDHAGLGLLHRALLSQQPSPPPPPLPPSPDRDDRTYELLIAVAAAALGGGSLDSTVTLLVDHLVAQRSGYAVDRRWDLTDTFEAVGRAAPAAAGLLATLYARATGR